MAGRITYYGGIVTQGLVLALDAAKRDSYAGTGTAWNDISGNRYNGALINGPTFNSSNGGSIVFDGVDDYTSVSPNILSVNTVCGWFRSTSTSGFRRLWQWGINEFSAYLNSGTYDLRIIYKQNDSPTGYSFSANTWTNVAATYNGTTLNVYIAGTQIFSSTRLPASSNNQILIGSTIGGTQNWNGNISQTLVYDRALSATEVLQNYNATKGRYL